MSARFTRASLARRSVVRGFALAALGLGLGLGAGGAADPARAAAPETPRALIEHYHTVLLQVMQSGGTTDPASRAATLEPTLRETYDYARMARAASGRAWREADAEAQAAMVEAFAAYSAAVHASRFNGYNGERFEILGTQPGPGGTTMVNTRIVKSGGDAVPIGYVVGETADGPRIADVLLDGTVSEVALRRSEWSAIAGSQGLAALAAALRDKAVGLLAGS